MMDKNDFGAFSDGLLLHRGWRIRLGFCGSGAPVLLKPLPTPTLAAVTGPNA